MNSPDESDTTAAVAARVSAEFGTTKPPAAPDPAVDLDRYLDLGERGIAEWLNTRIAGRYLFNVNSGWWLKFNKTAWEVDVAGEIYREFNGMADILEERIHLLEKRSTKDNPLDGPLKRLRRTFEKLNTGRYREAVLISATKCTDTPPTITTAELDPHRYLIPCNNRVVDLRTGEDGPGDHADHLTMRTNVDWQGLSAPAPTWLAALKAAHDDAAEVEFLQRLYGCALLGDGPLIQQMLIVQGVGSNFKGCFMRAILGAVGQYGATIATELLLESKFPRSASAPDASLMDLRGHRILFASESDQNRRAAAGRIKSLTGNDEVVARAPNDREMSRFFPTWFLTLHTNFAPTSPAGDPAYIRRLLYIKSRNVFVAEPKEPHERLRGPDLDNKLKAEAPGILAWLVKGAILYQKYGLQPPKSVLDAVTDYEMKGDYIKKFCAEMVEDSPANWEAVKETYNTFHKWFAMFIDDREKAIPGMRVFNELFQRKYPVGQSRRYHGIRIKAMPTE